MRTHTPAKHKMDIKYLSVTVFPFAFRDLFDRFNCNKFFFGHTPQLANAWLLSMLLLLLLLSSSFVIFFVWAAPLREFFLEHSLCLHQGR